MGKDTFYFTHDYNVRTDEKIKLLIRRHGMRGYGIFWAIIEDLYNNDNQLLFDPSGIAYDFREKSSLIESILKDFDLFVFENNFFGSISVEKRINERNSKSDKARKNAISRWSKMQTQCDGIENQCDGNAIKESKEKEIKEKEIKEKESKEESIELPFNGEVFSNIWLKWIEYKKKEHRFSYKTKESQQASLSELVKLSGGNEQNAIEIIAQSMANGWKGFFELKKAKITNNGNSDLEQRVQQAFNNRFGSK